MPRNPNAGTGPPSPSPPPPQPRPSGPTHPGRKHVEPIDPDSPGGRAAADALSQALAEITHAIRQRRAEKRAA